MDFVLGFIAGFTVATIAVALWLIPKLDEARESINKLKIDLLHK